MRFSITARLKRSKDKVPPANGPESKPKAVAGGQYKQCYQIQHYARAASYGANSKKEAGNKSKKEAKVEQKEEKSKKKAEEKQLKKILKTQKGNILSALQDAINRGAVTDIRLILFSPKIQSLNSSAWESILKDASASSDRDTLKLLLNKLPPTTSFSNDFFSHLLGVAVENQLWEQAVSISKRFSNGLRLRRVKLSLQNDREPELAFLLREYPALIKSLDSTTEPPRVPEEISRSAFRALLLQAHSGNLSSALANACHRNSIADVELLITHPSVNTETSGNWIHAIKSAISEQSTDILSLLLDRAPENGSVRESMLGELRSAVRDSLPDIGTDLFLKYIEKYSVVGVWNDMKWGEEWLLGFYLTVQPFYISEVAKKVGQPVLHLILSAWAEASVIKLVIDAGDVDIEAHFEKSYGDSHKGVAGTDQIDIGNPRDTPLIRATRMKSTDIVEALLDRGADIQAKDATGYTALHIAVWTGDSSMVRTLLKNGATTPTLTPDDMTAEDLAAKKFRQRIFNILREHHGLPQESIYNSAVHLGLGEHTHNLTATASGYGLYPNMVVKDRRRMVEYTLTASDGAYWN